jgi:pyruvate dehydrogenase (quinone)/pyruvate oxidase
MGQQGGMVRIASEALVERLIDWGVDTVFGLPGDGINGIMEGLRRHRDRVLPGAP